MRALVFFDFCGSVLVGFWNPLTTMSTKGFQSRCRGYFDMSSICIGFKDGLKSTHGQGHLFAFDGCFLECHDWYTPFTSLDYEGAFEQELYPPWGCLATR